MNEAINEYLTKVMGGCWHEENYGMYIKNNTRQCKRCQEWISIVSGADFSIVNTDFFTWAGFGVLWEWAQEQEWRTRGKWHQYNYLGESKYHMHLNPYYINPQRFAEAVYTFLKEREQQ